MFRKKQKKILLLLAFISFNFSCIPSESSSSETAELQRPLTIMFVVAYFPAPSQTYILNIITGLLDKGHKVFIFAFRKNTVEEGHPNIEKYGLLDSVIYEEFPEELPECDIVFCQSATLGKQIFEMPALKGGWFNNKKVVVCLRGFDITGNKVRENPRIYNGLFRRAHCFLPVCHYFKELAISLGCSPDKIIVHHSAIDCEQFFFRERKRADNRKDKIQCVSVCRLIQKKGLNFALEALAKVCKRFKNIHFTIVGSGHLQYSLQNLAKKLGILDKVTFFGWATQDQVVELLDKAHIFLLPSVTAVSGDEEGIANALKEAMAMGLISIGTFHAGTPELIEDEKSGFLVPERDSRSLAKKIKYVIEHPERWKNIALAARKKIEEEFETKKSIEKLEEIFYSLVDDSIGQEKNRLI